MTAAALRGNRARVEAGRATIVTASLHEAHPDSARFDTIFGLHFPPLLRGRRERDLAAIRGHLAPDADLRPLSPAARAPCPASDRPTVR